MKMGNNNVYHRLIMMLLALTNQFRSFMDDRPELTQDLNTREHLQKGLACKQAGYLDALILEDLNQLTELEEQSGGLEEELHRLMIEILSSPRRHLLKHVDELQNQLKKLQAELRAAIKFLERRSQGKSRRRIFRRIKSKLKRKESQDRRCPLRSQSCPNIPSEGLLEDPEFNFLKKWRSLNRTIEFKDSLEDMLKWFDGDLEHFEMSCRRIIDKLEKTWNVNFFQPQQLHPGRGCGRGPRGQNNSPLSSSRASGQDLRSEFQPSMSDSSRARETASNATSESSDQSSDQSVSHQVAFILLLLCLIVYR
ncbi:uncharacterized protein LOC117737460 [Cyclopterus lumpus]|uniref:uncharacterized protein LOC117737460 n=1 Tax=Cyclopterus lumpus TaxID=8103 RepID=UPI00148725DD|nr:uncharacterized protein LOC117737460 [Cyclopterus lumpus]